MEDKSSRFDFGSCTFRCCSADCVPLERLREVLGDSFIVTPFEGGYHIERRVPMQVNSEPLTRFKPMVVFP